eukprot:CAMPEP_0114597292 /NCGR_PEP_ID=MMETSP0125-20121206/19536_1 /TAXON_ID=485358 ORGANISM="Aristerostoma sp., Strain ATCC 50986" /NCGR_SAMPLE_ID=MMETSP0125 /ASSEMBLY_ACC=CAM_ASM_000245 /LENGTH=44 /DNA_ID= /DNA_START= /DNA_END= /DNA_ORIENTATION=
MAARENLLPLITRIGEKYDHMLDYKAMVPLKDIFREKYQKIKSG